MSTLPTNKSSPTLNKKKSRLLDSVKHIDARHQTGPSTQAYAFGATVASYYTDMWIPTENLYALLPSQPECQVQLQTSSGQTKKKLAYNFGEKIDFRFEQTNTRSEARFNVCRHGDIITSTGFGRNQLHLLCSTETGKPGFACLTKISDIDDQLRVIGYHPTAQDALEEAYRLVAKDRPELAWAKCSRKRTRDAKSDDEHASKARRTNACRRVPFIHPNDGKTEWLGVPHSHEISFNNQAVVFQEACRGLDPWQAVIRFSEETKRLNWDEDSEMDAYTMFASALNVPLEKLFHLRDFLQGEFDPLLPEDIIEVSANHGIDVAASPLSYDSSLRCCCPDCSFCKNLSAEEILVEYDDLDTLIA